MDIRLQQWYRDWMRDQRARDGQGMSELSQLHFVRDTLAPLMWWDRRYEEIPTYKLAWNDGEAGHEYVDTVRVVGEHRSKSTLLPVYRISRPEYDLELTMRYNFHDWNVSVRSDRFPFFMGDDLAEVVGAHMSKDEISQRKYEKPVGYWGYLFFQGFPDDCQFGPYSQVLSDDDRTMIGSMHRFSCAPTNDYDLYMLVFKIAAQLVPKLKR